MLLRNRSGHRKLFPFLVIPPIPVFPHSERIRQYVSSVINLQFSQQPNSLLFSRSPLKLHTTPIQTREEQEHVLIYTLARSSSSAPAEPERSSNPQLCSWREGAAGHKLSLIETSVLSSAPRCFVQSPLQLL